MGAITYYTLNNYDIPKTIKPNSGYSSALIICDSYGNCIPSAPGGVTNINLRDIEPCPNMTKPNPEYLKKCCIDGICLNYGAGMLDTYTINNIIINLTECEKIPKIIILNKTICHY